MIFVHILNFSLFRLDPKLIFCLPKKIITIIFSCVFYLINFLALSNQNIFDKMFKNYFLQFLNGLMLPNLLDKGNSVHIIFKVFKSIPTNGGNCFLLCSIIAVCFIDCSFKRTHYYIS